MDIRGLSNQEVQSKRSLGLSNTTIDSYTPTTLKIIIKNIFSVINVVIVPLIIYLIILSLYMESLSMGLFIIINTITSIVDELRIKKEIEQLKTKFQLKARVIREGVEGLIPIAEVVNGDTIKVNEGENIIADGIVLDSTVLQIDESMLTGESNYIKKYVNDKVFSGSFVVTGECYYRVDAVGMENFTNKIAFESTKYEKKKSPMQLNADKLISALIFCAIVLGLLNFAATFFSHEPYNQRILSVTTIVSLIIPQTLIFLFTLTFSISISKLFKKGVLVQKGASIENLTNVNIICMDKTGTITTNNMILREVKCFNFEEKKIGEYYNSVQSKLFGVNKSQKVIGDYFLKYKKENIKSVFQIPFNSKNKYSYSESKINNKNIGLLLGAKEKILPFISNSVKEEISKFINLKEESGYRVIVGALMDPIKEHEEIEDTLPKFSKTSEVAVFIIEEELNKGILNVINKFKEQGIGLKIISGDSYSSVKTIANKVGIPTNSIVDLSIDDIDIIDAAKKYTIFTRAKPEDKLIIINTLKNLGNVVAMTGDGINDVLSLKSADISIAMESGAEVTRNISDIVLLGNDYEKLPEVFFEGQNIIFNLKLSTKMFLAKSILAIVMGLVFTAAFSTIPILPTSVLIFSFLGSSLPSYILVFTRSNVVRSKSFFKEIFLSSVPAGVVMFSICLSEFLVLKQSALFPMSINTVIVLTILGLSLTYSIILMWEAGKLKNIFIISFAFIAAFLIGTMQATLPIEQNDPLILKIVLIALFVIAGSLLVILIKKKLKIKNKKIKILLYILSFIWIPIVSILPFRQYYSVTRLPLDVWLLIISMIFIGTLFMIIFNKIFKKLS